MQFPIGGIAREPLYLVGFGEIPRPTVKVWIEEDSYSSIIMMYYALLTLINMTLRYFNNISEFFIFYGYINF